jgi:hypothetical protein
VLDVAAHPLDPEKGLGAGGHRAVPVADVVVERAHHLAAVPRGLEVHKGEQPAVHLHGLLDVVDDETCGEAKNTMLVGGEAKNT